MEEESKKQFKKFGKMINTIFVCLILLGLTLIILKNKTRIDDYKETLLAINYWQLLIILVITICASVFRSWRWYYLLIPVKKNISMANVLRVNINALAANYSTPGKVGVPVKCYLLKKIENIEYSRSLPSILGELVLEYSIQISLIIISIFIGGHFSKLFLTVRKLTRSQNLTNNMIAMGAFIALLILLIFLFRKKIHLTSFIKKLTQAFHDTRKRLDCVLYSSIITTFNLLMGFFGFWLVILSLGHSEIDLTFVIFSSGITNLVGLISPLPGGLGAREITIYGLYDLYYGLGGIAFLAILVMRIITYLALFILFLLERAISNLMHAKRLKQYPIA